MEKSSGQNENIKTSQMPLQGTRMIIAACLIFAGCFLYMPSADLMRTIPFVAVFAAVADVVYKKMMYNTGMVFVFSFALLSLCGFGMIYAAVYSVSGAAFAILAIYGTRLLRAATKTERKDLKKKCNVRAITMLVLCFASYMLLCGNVISMFAAKSDNLQYIGKNYDGIAEIKYTDFDAVSREYKTYVTFTHQNSVVGESQKCFVSKEHDGIKEHFEDLLVLDMGKYLKLYLSETFDMFEITNSGLYLERDEILTGNSKASDYGNKAWYVVSLYHIVDNKYDFAKLCSQFVDSLNKYKEFTFSKIVVCGGSANEALYTFTLTLDSLGKDDVSVDEVKDFDEKYMRTFGVTEKTYLDYWQNK